MRSSAAQATRAPLMLAYCEQILNGLVNELYFPEELHAAGLRLFDLTAQAQLPEIRDILKVGGAASPSFSGNQGQAALATLRKLFETLCDGAHLCAARFSLGNLETVRIIEGKE